MGADIWGYAETSGHVPGTKLIGFTVEATDGTIGKVDKHTEDVGRSYLVVDTGPWIFGRRVLLPAGLVSLIDVENETVRLSCARDDIKDSPEFESGQHEDDSNIIKLIEHYYSNRHM
ncbi:PRC-barrel domain containing protein [Streptomyces sp. P9(2023)]|uniref:PRC-barrel domain containing protein n=1 Tax=Streptomyces sp. P9(2023) TaxID=3064394 RepID=UPI0028F42F39|nr:PRC-barrel domain containing protein [Streptomyces sp. P9(2023)]MDT9687619.1 PRC-barrel domain containing protein [Streptomyces sp. P9(2023)]